MGSHGGKGALKVTTQLYRENRENDNKKNLSRKHSECGVFVKTQEKPIELCVLPYS